MRRSPQIGRLPASTVTSQVIKGSEAEQWIVKWNGHEVIQFARDASKSSNQLDTAGQTILQLIQRAAGVAEDNSRQVLEMAQKLSHQLQSAEARVAELEADVDGYREKADRAEQWLHRI